MSELYFEISIQTDPDAFDVLIGLLSRYPVEGFLEEEYSLKCYIKEEDWTAERELELKKWLADLKSEGSVGRFTVKTSTVKNRNWNEEWERGIVPIEVTDRIIVRPSWHADKTEWAGKLVLVIDPKMAFGTGHHESTKLALKLLAKHLRQNDGVLDVGTGTGILAIAAAKLGASKVIAIDNDPWAFANATENVEQNGVKAQVTVGLRAVEDLPPSLFDLLLVNISRNAILKNMSLLSAKVGDTGRMILSGLLEVDADEMTAELKKHGFKIAEKLKENEWVGIASVKS